MSSAAIPDTKLQSQPSGLNSNSKKKAEVGHMLPQTKKMLQDFYRHHNAQLAHLLGNNKWTWGY